MTLKLTTKALLLILFSLFLVSCSSAQIANSPTDEDTVAQVIEKYRKALENRSLVEMEQTVREDLLVTISLTFCQSPLVLIVLP